MPALWNQHQYALRCCLHFYSLSVSQQADLEAQTRQVADREAASAERTAALQRRADEVAQAERDAAEGHEALEAAIAARVRRHAAYFLQLIPVGEPAQPIADRLQHIAHQSSQQRLRP